MNQKDIDTLQKLENTIRGKDGMYLMWATDCKNSRLYFRGWGYSHLPRRYPINDPVFVFEADQSVSLEEFVKVLLGAITANSNLVSSIIFQPPWSAYGVGE